VGLVPEHSPEIEARRDEADLIAYPVRNEGGLRVVEDDAFLAIDPARLADDASEDGIKAEHGDVNELGDLGREGGARRDDYRPFPLAVRNGAGLRRS
jgi:hypothetical protein